MVFEKSYILNVCCEVHDLGDIVVRLCRVGFKEHINVSAVLNVGNKVANFSGTEPVGIKYYCLGYLEIMSYISWDHESIDEGFEEKM